MTLPETEAGSPGTERRRAGRAGDLRLARLLALALDTPAEQRRAVLEAAEPDSSIVDLALQTLAADDPLFLSEPAARRLSKLGPLETLPEFPGYTVLSLLGRGGMGGVFLASDDAAPSHRVAIKRMRPSLDDGALGRRFALERDALARLQHPAVARLFATGTTPDGRPYVVMEYVDGRPITRYCDDEGLSVEERLRLFVATCRGVEHAHRRQLLHRDLKPSNVLVSTIDGATSPKIIDFGIARILDGPEDAAPTLTDSAIGTPAYMSPEALSLGSGPRDLDTRTDVFSLGVVLYELLVGHRPWDGRADDPLLPSRILREDPPPPSTRWRALDGEAVAAAARARGTDVAAMVSRLAGDLDWIVMKALERDRNRRYGSVGELANDVERHLRLEPIEARPPTLRYRADRFVRRHRAPVAAALVATVALLTGSTAAVVGMVRARAAAREATAAREEAEAVAAFMEQVFQASSPITRDSGRRPWEATARELLDQGAARVADDLAGQPGQAAWVRSTLGGVYVGLGLYEDARELLTQAVADFERVDSSTHQLRHVITEWKLAQALFLLSRLDEALVHLDRSEAAARRHLEGSELARELSRCSTIRGRIYKRQARFDLAEKSLKEAISMLREAGLHEPALTFALNNLAGLYATQKRWAEAEDFSRQSLAVARTLYPAGHLSIAQDLGSLGAAIGNQGRHGEALALLLEADGMMRAALPEDHPVLARNLTSLGNVALARGHAEEAVGYHRQALEIRLRAWGQEHPETAESHHGLGVALAALGRDAEAIAELEQALATQRAALGDGHPDIGSTLEALRAIGWPQAD